MAENWGDYRARSRDIQGQIYKASGTDVYVWWDNDSSRFRCHWQDRELMPQVNSKPDETVDTATDRMAQEWMQEITRRKEDARPAP